MARRLQMARRLRGLLSSPLPLRLHALYFLDAWLDFLPYRSKLNHALIERAYYGYSLLHAAELARKLQDPRISAIEFGVAAGNGLLSLEDHARRVTDETGVAISIFGFDTGTGMPPPRDYRDIPYLWQAGYFVMDDPTKLRAKLKLSKLVFGKVEDTVERFCREENPPPIGFIAFDLDYYSSTLAALSIFDQKTSYFLPRVVCYFDDTVGDIDWGYNRFTGELLAIEEFNSTHEHIKLDQVRGLRFFGHKLPRAWHEPIYVAHLFQHPKYCRPISELTQLPLTTD
jgi:hypothetical protein